MNDYVMVTDWECVDIEDFYLSESWADRVDSEVLKQAKKLQANDDLYVAYVVPAVSYVIYRQMDAHQIFINSEGNEIMSCETVIIGNKHWDHFEYNY